MNPNLNKALIKDFSLPIPIKEEPYFSHFVALLEPFFNINELIILQKETLNHFTTVDDFLSYHHKLSDKIITDLKSNPEFEKFSSFPMENFPAVNFSQINNLYNVNNHGKKFISLDMIKANYSVLQKHFPNLIKNSSSYDDFLLNYTQHEYFIKSKSLRQFIFGNLNPKRQQALQKYNMSLLLNSILKQGIFKDVNFSSSDELVFASENITKDLELIQKIVDESPVREFIKIQSFELQSLDNRPYFVKQYTDSNKVEFKNIPGPYLAECVRYFLNQTPNPLDRKFINDGRICSFDEPLFKNY